MSRILVVDDSSIERELLRNMLECGGHTVDEAQNGQRAIEKLEGASFDVLLLDIYMPGMDGFEALLRIRTLWPEVGIVCMSGAKLCAALDVLAMAERLGADCSIRKPFDPQKVLAAVEAVRLSAPRGAVTVSSEDNSNALQA